MNKPEETENKYQRGKIYKLVSYQIEKCYVGSTCEQYLCNRLSGHKRAFKKYQNGKCSKVTSFELVSYDDCQIILVENYPCMSKQELLSRERYWIETLDCVNKIVPTRTAQEYYLHNREHKLERNRQLYEKNKARISEKRKQQYESNKEKRRQYYEANKEKITARKKQHYEDIKEKLNQPCTCECGSIFSTQGKTRHFKSEKHQSWSKSLEK